MKLQKAWIFQKSANPHFPCKTAEGYRQHVLSHQAIKKDIVFCLAEDNREIGKALNAKGLKNYNIQPKEKKESVGGK